MQGRTSSAEALTVKRPWEAGMQPRASGAFLWWNKVKTEGTLLTESKSLKAALLNTWTLSDALLSALQHRQDKQSLHAHIFWNCANALTTNLAERTTKCKFFKGFRINGIMDEAEPICLLKIKQFICHRMQFQLEISYQHYFKRSWKKKSPFFNLKYK